MKLSKLVILGLISLLSYTAMVVFSPLAGCRTSRDCGIFAVSVAAGIRAPIKRLNEMSITETIGQL